MIRDPHQLSKSHRIEATFACSTWKLYDNPLYCCHHRRPLSPRKDNFGANCHWDPTFFPSTIMDSELVIARAQITELKAELEFQRKARKKVESLNKKLTKELSEEMTRREAIDNVCEKLAEEIALDKAEMNRLKREMEEERKMLRIAEVLREERVQMKLTEAKLLFEEKISELELSKGGVIVQVEEASPLMKCEEDSIGSRAVCSTTDIDDSPLIIGSYEKSASSNINGTGGTCMRSTSSKRRGSPEAENPHIKRGIKGFVEFPRVVRAISSRGRQLGSKLECQKAQLRLLVRQKSPTPSDNLIMG